MEISLLKALLGNISSFLNLSSFKNINSEPVQKYYLRAEEILKLLKPIILNAIVDSEIISDELLNMVFEGLCLSIEELRKQFESWQPLMSKVYFVLQVESLISKIRNSSLDIFQLLKSSNQHIPDGVSSASLEKIKHVGYEQTSSVIKEAIRDQVDGVGPSSEILVKIAESLSLSSNLEILIEVFALEKLKENAEQAEKTAEVEFFDQLFALVSGMHHHLVLMKQSQTCSPVLIPANFCCPLSLELMIDPVIVASGQNYERAFIKKWIDLGLTVCPKTRQTLAHTNLIPNYTVKALIANWCESNNVKLPDSMMSLSLNQPHLLMNAESGLPRDSNRFLHSRSSQSRSPKSRSTGQSDHMGITLLKALLGNISSFLNLSSFENINSEPVQKYYQRAEEILKLLKPIILDANVDSEITSDEVLIMAFERLSLSIKELGEQFESWQPLLSKVYFVLQVESLISKIQNSSLDIFHLLKSSNQHLPGELSSASLEHCLQKIKHVGYEQTSSVIREAIRDQVDSVGPSSDILVKIAENLSLSSNPEILIEVVALEELKENAEQAEKTAEVEFIDQLIALVTRMHHRLVLMKQSQNCGSVLIPADFICPLSLELMIDPVIVASGQNYERAFIKKWIDLGLTVCPKTRQTLAHTTLIPNYTIKALVAHWCESNNLKLPDSMESMGLNQPYLLLVNSESGLPRDSNGFLHYRSSQSLSRKSRSTGQSGKKLITSNKHHQDGTSQIHHCSTSEGSLPGIAGNGEGMDVARSLNSAQDRSNLEQMGSNSIGQPPMSPSCKEFHNSGQSSQNNIRSDSASSTLFNSDFPRGAVGEANETSEGSTHLAAYSSDVSGELKSDPQTAASTGIPQREPEFPPRLLDAQSRSQTIIWRRPSERFIPRIVSSPAIENRAELSGIETQVKKLVEDLKSTSVSTQREATAQLRLLAKQNMDNRIMIANCGAISLLVDLLLSPDTKTQENAVTALLNSSVNDNNRIAIANANAIEPLIHVLGTGSNEAKENSAATLFSLSVIEDNKFKIGRSGAIRPLVDLLQNGTPRGKKDAATALFSLSILNEIKPRIVQAGAVRHLVDLMDPAAGMVDKVVAVLTNLAKIPEGRSAIGQEGGIPLLVIAVELGSAKGKENAAAALLQLCVYSNRYCNMVLQEGAVPPLLALYQSGTPRAKEKAMALLSYFRNRRHGYA